MIRFITPPEVAELRTRIDELRADIVELESAPLSDKEAFERAGQMIAAHAARAQTGRILQHLIHGGASALVAWPYDPTSEEGAEIQPAAFDLLCALDGKHMQKLLEGLVKESDHRRGSNKAARAASLTELHRELRSAEVEEEAAIVAAERTGQHVHRRADADPAVILKLESNP